MTSTAFQGHAKGLGKRTDSLHFELTKGGWRFVGLDNINE